MEKITLHIITDTEGKTVIIDFFNNKYYGEYDYWSNEQNKLINIGFELGSMNRYSSIDVKHIMFEGCDIDINLDSINKDSPKTALLNLIENYSDSKEDVDDILDYYQLPENFLAS